MWGLRAASRTVREAGQMFPTHVGIARTALASSDRGHYVPYACGDCAPPKLAVRKVKQCSLRMWGLRDSAAPPVDDHDMFPTHVGIARPSTRRGMDSPDVPYACGDCARSFALFFVLFLCSLRMWGLRVFFLYRPFFAYMFPTHVGIARVPAIHSALARHVPYACGDCAARQWASCARMICSLRMWGLRGVQSCTPSL